MVGIFTPNVKIRTPRHRKVQGPIGGPSACSGRAGRRAASVWSPCPCGAPRLTDWLTLRCWARAGWGAGEEERQAGARWVLMARSSGHLASLLPGFAKGA